MEQQDLPQVQPPQQNNAKVFVILGWVFAGLSILFGFFTAIPGIVMGILAIVKGAKTHGIWIIVVSVLVMILSLVISSILMAWVFSNIPMDPSLQHQ